MNKIVFIPDNYSEKHVITLESHLGNKASQWSFPIEVYKCLFVHLIALYIRDNCKFHPENIDLCALYYYVDKDLYQKFRSFCNE